ncbi:Hsp33 family molecular chaperone HslO [Congregibacter brevis]|uniref:33 kDa chaperonin n=1 Tax=Congregibacter brevis TaxID=3081201 RepID=A0ABZ0IGS3_9GAMM|nr:Hsp33 family molecular chaperone HslO [Congregibacter sp. IMCC45268]
MTIPTEISAIRHADGKRRFLFEKMDLRGEIVHLDQVITDVSEIHSYPPGVSRLLGEFLVASVLLASTLKFRGSLTVQARSDREIPLIMAECSSELTVRAIARGAEAATSESFDALLGGGQLVLTITPERGKQYQGIVPLTGGSLASSLDSYFSQSEQLQTRLQLSSDGSRAAGLLLQQLPPQLEPNAAAREEQWDRACMLAATLSPEELIQLGDATLLHRLYHEEVIRLFDLEAVRFRCSCSQDRTFAALATLGEEEIRDIIAEQGAVTMDCEFCNQRYMFRESDLRGLLGSGDNAPIH